MTHTSITIPSAFLAESLLTSTVSIHPESSIEAESLKSLSPLKLTMNGQKVDQHAVECGTYKRFTQKELEERELTVNDKGLLIFRNKPLSTIGKINYVMLQNGKFYVAYPKEGVCYHSSLVPATCPGPIAAGRLYSINGVLCEIDGASGHFAPSKQATQAAFDRLKILGALFKGVGIKIKETDGSAERSTSLSEYEREQRLQEILNKKIHGEDVRKLPQSGVTPSMGLTTLSIRKSPGLSSRARKILTIPLELPGVKTEVLEKFFPNS